MPDEENATRKGKLRRVLLDVLGAVGGLVALFQFVVSDNVSSQWFRPARNWLAEAMDLSEELGAFSGWWSEFTAPFAPGRLQFHEWPIVSRIVLLLIALFSLLLLGTLFVTFIEEVAKFRTGFGWSTAALLSVSVVVSVYTLWVLSAATAPLWVWILLAIPFFGGVGWFVWDNTPASRRVTQSAHWAQKPLSGAKYGGSSDSGYGQSSYGQAPYGQSGYGDWLNLNQNPLHVEQKWGNSAPPPMQNPYSYEPPQERDISPPLSGMRDSAPPSRPVQAQDDSPVQAQDDSAWPSGLDLPPPPSSVRIFRSSSGLDFPPPRGWGEKSPSEE
ncbi:hypothetical protein [Streptosporangium sp. NPDC002524]|uniref:hypothetical protein n=1 Tax=Streptosporangium sp. NPDC002524 TaxID=3154537 RepID=UPI00332632C6